MGNHEDQIRTGVGRDASGGKHRYRANGHNGVDCADERSSSRYPSHKDETWGDGGDIKYRNKNVSHHTAAGGLKRCAIAFKSFDTSGISTRGGDCIFFFSLPLIPSSHQPPSDPVTEECNIKRFITKCSSPFLFLLMLMWNPFRSDSPF